MKSNKKGFTLLELIITIVLLGIVGGVVIYNLTSISSKSKEEEYNRFVATVKAAAGVYATNNESVFQDLYVNKAYLYITTGDLINGGYLAEDLTNPYTKQHIGKDELIKANLDSTTGSLTFTYPYDGSNEEQYLVAINDYVIFGEPYDCYQGEGTYRLALSDEKGNLIDISSDEAKKKYQFTCTYPNDWDEYNGDVVSARGLKHKEQAGNYQITYTWITDSGTKKTATRTITVMDKFIPDLDVKEVTNKTYSDNGAPSVTQAEWNAGNVVNIGTTNNPITYNPRYNKDSKEWTFLAFKLNILGADTSQSSYTLSKRVDPNIRNVFGSNKRDDQNYGTSNNPVDYGDGKDWNRIYVADDGAMIYHLTTTTSGRYIKDYKYTSENDVEVVQELKIDPSLISGGSNKYELEKAVDITDTYSPVGIAKYQYKRVAEGESDQANDNPGPDANNLTNTFDRTGKVTRDIITLKNTNQQVTGSGKCGNNTTTYEHVYYRAINKNGYYGPWTKLQVNLNVTNNLSYIIKTDNTGDGDTSCNSCQNVSHLSDASLYQYKDSSLYNLSCYYCNKSRYLSYGGNSMRVLGRYTNSDLLVTPGLDNLTCANGRKFDIVSSPSTIRTGTWTVHTCDGTYSANFNYTTVVLQNFINRYSDYESCFNDASRFANFTSIFKTHHWGADIGTVDYSKMPDWVNTYNSNYNAWTSEEHVRAEANKWANALSRTTQTYDGYFGGPTTRQYTKVFGAALRENAPYWLMSTTTLENGTVQVTHGDRTTIKNTYWDVAQPNGSVTVGYQGDSHNTVAMAVMDVDAAPICGGSGTQNDPYVVSQGVQQ